MTKYHVNPYTAVPGVCYAKEGNCPFGGSESHYSSYEEAQDKAFRLMENEYSMFEDAGENLYSEEFIEIEDYLENSIILEENYDYLNEGSKEDIINEISLTNDKVLLEGIITQQIEVGEPDDLDDFIVAAIQNKNVPKEWVTDAVNNPNDYSNKFISGLIDSPTISEDDLIDIGQRTNSSAIRNKALTSDKISRETIVLNIGEDGLQEAPEIALHFGKNPNCPPLASENARKRLIKIRSDRLYNK